MATGVTQAEQMGTALASHGEHLSLGWDDRASPVGHSLHPSSALVLSSHPQLLLLGINKDECTCECTLDGERQAQGTVLCVCVGGAPLP